MLGADRGLVLSPIRSSLRAPAALLLACALLVACTDEEPAPPSRTASATPTPQSRATEPPRPEEDACYRLGFEEAIAYTSATEPRSCDRRHTARTYAVGELDTVVDGHLVTVDSDRVVTQVAQACPRLLPDFLGGTRNDLRLSMLRAVWFTPTLEQSDAGANWFRCDVIAVASEKNLATLGTDTEGVLGTPSGRDRYGMCGTAAPDARGFERVMCGREHSWRAVEVVAFETEEYPGEQTAQQRGQEQCEQAGSERAADPLDFQWGYEWPQQVQWDAGIHYGLCWVPD